MTTFLTLALESLADGLFSSWLTTAVSCEPFSRSAGLLATGCFESKKFCQFVVISVVAVASLKGAGDGELLLEPELPPLLLLHAASNPALNAPAAIRGAIRPVVLLANAIAPPFSRDLRSSIAFSAAENGDFAKGLLCRVC